MVKFTEKVRTKTMSFIIGADELYTAHCVIIETLDGRKMTIKDSDSPYGVMGADSRYEAIKKGEEFLKRMKDRGNI